MGPIFLATLSATCGGFHFQNSSPFLLDHFTFEVSWESSWNFRKVATNDSFACQASLRGGVGPAPIIPASLGNSL